MLIKSKTQSFKVKNCKSLFSKLRGFIFRFAFKKDGLLFAFKKETIVSITMLFVFRKLYIIYLNKNKKIIKIDKVKPFKPLFFSPKCKYILELKEIKQLKKGDFLTFHSK